MQTSEIRPQPPHHRPHSFGQIAGIICVIKTCGLPASPAIQSTCLLLTFSWHSSFPSKEDDGGKGFSSENSDAFRVGVDIDTLLCRLIFTKLYIVYDSFKRYVYLYSMAFIKNFTINV